MHKKHRIPRDFELRIMTLQSWASSLGRVIGPTRMVYAGALGLRLGSFYSCVLSNLRDWIRIYLRFVHEAAEAMYSSIMKILLVGAFHLN